MVLLDRTVGETNRSEEDSTTEPTKAEVIAQILNQKDMKFVDWKGLMGNGVVAKLHIRRTRFTAKTKYEDLGITFADEETKQVMTEMFTLGMKRLLPEKEWEELQDADYNARMTLEKYSIQTVWGRFIPWTAHAKWLKKMEEYETAYFAAQQAILDNYKKVKKEVVDAHTIAARNAYRHINKVNPESLTERERENEARFIASVRMGIKKAFPTKAEISESFAFEIEETYIDLPRLAGNSDEDLPVAPGAVLESNTIEGVSAPESKRLQMFQEGAKQRQQMIEAMNREVVERARKKKQERIDDFLEAAVSQVRGLLYEACTDVLASLKKRDGLHPRSAKQLAVLVEKLNMLNFYNDNDVNRAVALIKDQVEKPHKERNLPQIEQTLGQIAVVMRSTLLPLEYEFREEREEKALLARQKAGIPDEPSREEVREARMALEMSLPRWEVSAVRSEDSDARFDRSL